MTVTTTRLPKSSNMFFLLHVYPFHDMIEMMKKEVEKEDYFNVFCNLSITSNERPVPMATDSSGFAAI